MSVIQWAARNAAGNALAMDEYSGKFFANGAHPSIVLSTDKRMDPGQVTALQTAFAAKYSGNDNAHRLPLVLTEGLTQESLSLSADDSQLLEARKFQVIDIARAFGVPPHLIGETSASTSWGSGIESMGLGFVRFTLQPYLVRIEQEINRKLFPSSAKYFVEFNRDALMEGDSIGQANYFRAALGGPGSGPGWMSVDDVRRVKNLSPKGGRAAEIFDPRDVAASASKPTPKEPNEETPPTPA
jgi:HK97 family phage portal protein